MLRMAHPKNVSTVANGYNNVSDSRHILPTNTALTAPRVGTMIARVACFGKTKEPSLEHTSARFSKLFKPEKDIGSH